MFGVQHLYIGITPKQELCFLTLRKLEAVTSPLQNCKCAITSWQSSVSICGGKWFACSTAFVNPVGKEAKHVDYRANANPLNLLGEFLQYKYMYM